MKKNKKLFFSVLLEYLFSILLLSTLLIIYSYYFILPSDIEELSKNIISAIIFSSNLFYFFNGYYFPLNELDFIPYYNLWFTSSIIQHLLCIYLIFKFFKITIKKILTVFLFSLFLYFYVKDSYELLTFLFYSF